MSALPQLGPSGDLFKKPGSTLSSFEYAQKESRNSYDIDGKKKRRAPAPPSGLGQYKPKILSSDNEGGVPVAAPREEETPVAPPRPSKGRSSQYGQDMGSAKPFVVGDKDVPMMLSPQHDIEEEEEDVDLNVSSLNLTSHDALNGHEDTGTDNPLFTMQDENVTTPQPAASTLPSENNEAVHPSDDPSFSTLEERDIDYPYEDQKGDEADPEGLYIPPPDYDEEEQMMAIPEEPVENHPRSPRRSSQVFKEYDGEDFGQYLSDEENNLEEVLRRPVPIRSKGPLDMKFKTAEVKRSQNKRRQSLPTQSKKEKTGYSSLRTFSYADSKFGTLNRNKNPAGFLSRPERNKEAESFTGASYEHFLYSQSGGDWDEPERDYGFMQEASSVSPGHARSKDSVWKRLTWRSKKQRNSFDLTAPS